MVNEIVEGSLVKTVDMEGEMSELDETDTKVVLVEEAPTWELTEVEKSSTDGTKLEVTYEEGERDKDGVSDLDIKGNNE